MKKLILKMVAKNAERAVEAVGGEKSLFYYYEPEMPAILKAKKQKTNEK